MPVEPSSSVNCREIALWDRENVLQYNQWSRYHTISGPDISIQSVVIKSIFICKFVLHFQSYSAYFLQKLAAAKSFRSTPEKNNSSKEGFDKNFRACLVLIYRDENSPIF